MLCRKERYWVQMLFNRVFSAFACEAYNSPGFLGMWGSMSKHGSIWSKGKALLASIPGQYIDLGQNSVHYQQKIFSALPFLEVHFFSWILLFFALYAPHVLTGALFGIFSAFPLTYQGKNMHVSDIFLPKPSQFLPIISFSLFYSLLVLVNFC